MDGHYVSKRCKDLQHGDIFCFEAPLDNISELDHTPEFSQICLKVCCRYGERITYYHLMQEYWTSNLSPEILDKKVRHFVNEKINCRKMEIILLHWLNNLLGEFKDDSLDWFLAYLRREIVL